jgi:Arc/MetJ-type ribon-helix-helix transcriptional regulator
MNRKTKMTEQIGVRLETDLLAEIEAWANTIRPRPSKSAAVRELVIEGLASFKRKEGEKPKGRKS